SQVNDDPEALNDDAAKTIDKPLLPRTLGVVDRVEPGSLPVEVVKNSLLKAHARVPGRAARIGSLAANERASHGSTEDSRSGSRVPASGKVFADGKDRA